MKDHFAQFSEKQNGRRERVGDRFYLKFWANRPPFERNRRFSIDIELVFCIFFTFVLPRMAQNEYSLVAPQPTPSEKVQLTLIESALCAF